MRHLKAHRKLGRTSEHRHSMLRNLATSLINSREERIVTTLPKAKELRPFVERAITLSRKARSFADNGSDARALHLRRQAAGYFHAGNTTVSELTGKRGQLRPERTAGVAPAPSGRKPDGSLRALVRGYCNHCEPYRTMCAVNMPVFVEILCRRCAPARCTRASCNR